MKPVTNLVALHVGQHIIQEDQIRLLARCQRQAFRAVLGQHDLIIRRLPGQAALNEFAQGPARRAADDVGAAFDRAGARIAQTLSRAALSGEVSFKRLAKVVLEELARLALSQIFGKGGSLSFFGAKAGGGAVNAGGAYLVGERGPEIFAPRQSGTLSPAASGVRP